VNAVEVIEQAVNLILLDEVESADALLAGQAHGGDPSAFILAWSALPFARYIAAGDWERAGAVACLAFEARKRVPREESA
jgi:hypothetical protein